MNHSIDLSFPHEKDLAIYSTVRGNPCPPKYFLFVVSLQCLPSTQAATQV